MKGYVHLYEGEGKGKTTCAVGLAIRMAGAGGRVVFTQFLKTDTSSELKVLEAIPEISLVKAGKSFGFVSRMSEEQRREAAAFYTNHFKKVLVRIEDEKPDLVIFDEMMAALTYHMVEMEEVLAFLERRPKEMEVVFTGRNAPQLLREKADYITEMTKRKHPFDKGVQARKGVEY